EVAHRLGAVVTLVSTASLDLALDTAGGIEVVHVDSAAQMHDAMMERTNANDCVIMAAAVADFTVQPSPVKIKRRTGPPDLHFEPTADILHDLVAKRHEGQIIVGFAAETNDVEHNGLAKLRQKDVDLLVVNDVAAPGAGFEHVTNEVTLLGRDEVAERVSMRSKEAVSLAILTRVASLLSRGAP
ncbi:MAG TPA: phosphopantothenoylcysteine decarboxylase, partial [Acidimicrobiales bacterium]